MSSRESLDLGRKLDELLSPTDEEPVSDLELQAALHAVKRVRQFRKGNSSRSAQGGDKQPTTLSSEAEAVRASHPEAYDATREWLQWLLTRTDVNDARPVVRALWFEKATEDLRNHTPKDPPRYGLRIPEDVPKDEVSESDIFIMRLIKQSATDYLAYKALLVVRDEYRAKNCRMPPHLENWECEHEQGVVRMPSRNRKHWATNMIRDWGIAKAAQKLVGDYSIKPMRACDIVSAVLGELNPEKGVSTKTVHRIFRKKFPT